MKKYGWIILLILLLALVSRPNKEDHKEKINTEFKGDNPITGALGAGKLFSGLIEYHDGYLFSYTTFRDETVSFGVFKMVFVYKDLDILEEKEQ